MCPSYVTASCPDSATQNADDTQETELRVLPAKAGVGRPQDDPSHSRASPDSSTAAQNDGVGHETP